MHKTVSYCYPTSSGAAAMKRSKAGCFAVSVGEIAKPHTVHFGPFDTVTQAETHADAINLPWSGSYQRYPLPGSKFKRGA